MLAAPLRALLVARPQIEGGRGVKTGKKENFPLYLGEISFMKKRGGGKTYHILGKYTPLVDVGFDGGVEGGGGLLGVQPLQQLYKLRSSVLLINQSINQPIDQK